MRPGRFRERETHVARYAWPAGVGAAGAAWYAADSLRHRRESGHGYRLDGEVDVADASFLRKPFPPDELARVVRRVLDAA